MLRSVEFSKLYEEDKYIYTYVPCMEQGFLILFVPL